MVWQRFKELVPLLAGTFLLTFETVTGGERELVFVVGFALCSQTGQTWLGNVLTPKPHQMEKIP